MNPVITDNILELFVDSTNNYIDNSSPLFKRSERTINNLKRGIKSDFTLMKSYKNPGSRPSKTFSDNDQPFQ